MTTEEILEEKEKLQGLQELEAKVDKIGTAFNAFLRLLNGKLKVLNQNQVETNQNAAPDKPAR
jgi:hypothetical protein